MIEISSVLASLTLTAVPSEPGETNTTPGTLEEFESRFGLIPNTETEIMMWDAVPEGVDVAYVWTIVEDEDIDFLEPGYRRVNRQGYVIAKHPRKDKANAYRSYVYDEWERDEDELEEDDEGHDAED